jgi:hypothetical protein
MRVIIAIVAALVAVPTGAHAQYETYEEYQADMDRQAARDQAYLDRREMLKLQREAVEAEKQQAYELQEMRQDQFWRDARDRQEREEQRRWDALP